MSELDLFSGRDGPVPGKGDTDAGTEAKERNAPLAARMRPRTLAEFVGQEHLLGEGKALRGMLEAGEPSSLILWGPPGSGKTTLARLIAEETATRFVSFSAVTDGIPRVREIVKEARARLEATGRRTILFCDEIHRFNKAQQDAFLPHVESGTVILIGATTENPSFEVVRPLLSRAPVLVLEPLTVPQLAGILERALEDPDRGLGGLRVRADEGVLAWLAEQADGDARRALGVLERAAHLAGPGGRVDEEVAGEALQHRFAVYDKGGEEHFNLISALHKSVRGSDPDAALYWLARMLEGGEDPLYLARRLIRMAVEDVGLADPQALSVAMSARDAYHFLGSPEGELALAEATVYLAVAAKSNRVYQAWKEAREAAGETRSAPVPMHIRNAPTRLMKDLGYGKGYEYEPSLPSGVSAQSFLPEEVGERAFYEPAAVGFERTVAERMEWFANKRAEARAREGSGEPSPE
ncbi:MAG: replication-associated recombination protein A [Gemmatimonadales bacterium]|jgi:putative ATPase|nr:MAG: replication-associated recombination protein A [Gemmatimonadales bacterium]